MNWDDDIDFMANKKSAKQGRRAGLTHSPETQEVSFDGGDDLQVPSRMRRPGKWAEEASKSARKNSTNLIEQERFRDVRKEDSDEEDDIPVIPDMDDLQEDIMPLHNAKAPTVSVNTATYKELDTELVSLQRGQKLANTGNVNLAFLTSRLHSEKDVREEDQIWSLESLLEHLYNFNK